MNNEASAVGTGFLDRFINMFFEPMKVFASIAQKPGWALPWLFIFVIHASAYITLKDIFVVEKAKIVREALDKQQGMTDEQKEQAVEMTKRLWFIDLIVLFIWFLIMILLGGLVLKLVGNGVLGGRIEFTTAASVFAYIQLIDVPMWLVKGPLIYVTESLRADTGLGLLIPEASILSTHYVLLSSIDLFSLWKVILAGLGLAYFTTAGTRKAMIVVFTCWIVYVLTRTGLSTINVHLP